MRDFLLALIATGSLAACTSSGHVTNTGESVYTSDVRKLVVEDVGGNLGPPPGAACDPRDDNYTLTVAGHRLDWQYCEVAGSGSTATYTPRTGSRALQDAEWSALQPVLAALIVSDLQRCVPYDIPGIAVIVTTSAGDLEYHDDAHLCDPSQPHVAGAALRDAVAVLGALAHP